MFSDNYSKHVLTTEITTSALYHTTYLRIKTRSIEYKKTPVKSRWLQGVYKGQSSTFEVQRTFLSHCSTLNVKYRPIL